MADDYGNVIPGPASWFVPGQEPGHIGPPPGPPALPAPPAPRAQAPQYPQVPQYEPPSPPPVFRPAMSGLGEYMPPLPPAGWTELTPSAGGLSMPPGAAAYYDNRLPVAMGADDGAATAHMLGAAMLLVGVGAAIGLKYGGVFGGVAGGLLGGAAVNGYRAVKSVTAGTPEGDREAIISGSYAFAGTGVAAYLIYKATQSETRSGTIPGAARARFNSNDDEEEDDDAHERAKRRLMAAGGAR